jgi:peptidoglycan hydrolase CwlO-like protein
MEITSIVIGILSAITTFSIGYSVIGVFRINKKIENVNELIQSIHKDIEDVHRRIDIDIQTNKNYIDEVQSNLDETEKDIISLLDRRLDKLENKIKGMIPPTNDELMKRIQNIEEQSHRLRMNM